MSQRNSVLALIPLISFLFLTSFAQVQKSGSHAEPQSSPDKVADEDKVYSRKEVDTKVTILNRKEIDPGKLGASLDCQNGAMVILRVVLHKSGKVTEVKIKRSSQCSLDVKAEKAVRSIKFMPATKDGVAVSQYIEMKFQFRKF